MILGIIPARGGSKSVPRKNLKLLAGKPLIYYTIEAARQSKLLDKIMVSTDDEEILGIAENLGVETIKRPIELAQDDTPMIEVIKHAVQILESEGNKIEIIVVLQPTSPLRTAEEIDNTIKKVIDGADSAETFVEVKQRPEYMFRIVGENAIPVDKDNLLKQRQELEKLCYENGAVYAITRKQLDKNSFYGNDHRAVMMLEERSIDIDSITDFKIAEVLLNERNKNTR